MSTEENKALARRWGEEIWGKGNLALIDEILASNFVFNYPLPGVASDLEGYKQTVNMMRTPFSDVETNPEEMVAEEDKVVVRWKWGGTHKGEFMGIPPTGKKVMITGISILRFEGGKIAEEWGEMDNMGMMQQLGVVPTQEQEKE